MVRGKARGEPAKPRQSRKKKGDAPPTPDQEQAGAESAAPEAAPPPKGHNVTNGLTDDQRAALTIQHAGLYKKALDAKKKAANEFLKVCKTIKGDLGADALDDVKAVLEIDDDADAFKARMVALARVARWMQLPIGAEPGLFDAEDRTPADDRAFGEGKLASSRGESRNPPYHPAVSQYRRWMDGYDANQAALMSGFKKLNPDTPLEAAVAAAPAAEKTAADGQPAAQDASDGLPRGSVPAANGATQEPWPDDADVKADKEQIGDRKPSLRVVE